jgi:hypothetical protein
MLIDNILLAKIDIIKMKPQINTDDLSVVKKLILDFCQTYNVISGYICELFITIKNESQP